MARSSRSEPALAEPWLVHYFRRHKQDDPARAVPAREFLGACPTEVRAHPVAVIKAVAESPPPRFGGGLQWQAMHGDMKGWFEARDRHGRWLYRVFCVLERDGAAIGLGGPSLVLITGMRKPNETAFTSRDYARVRKLGDEYRARTPRSVLR
ncbi:MAG: hypothetical protein M3Z84_01465 [Actinomycetota bacterium]|nr:hypothetical protein [Actinomycetota bacterium]